MIFADTAYYHSVAQFMGTFLMNPTFGQYEPFVSCIHKRGHTVSGAQFVALEHRNIKFWNVRQSWNALHSARKTQTLSSG